MVVEAPQGIEGRPHSTPALKLSLRSRSFGRRFRQTRCLIPASGYYDWQDTATGKQPWYFTCADGEPMTFAGLWDE
jgi:putative SOS response-associated peptidase YedK